MRKSAKSALVLVVIYLVTLPRVAAAQYIDPGTSSLIWQLLLTGFVGAGFVFRTRVHDLFRSLRRRPVTPDNGDSLDRPESDQSQIVSDK